MITDKEKCVTAIMSDSWRRKQCSRKAKFFEDGKGYCKQHLPSNVKDRYLVEEEKSNKKFKEKSAIEKSTRKAVKYHDKLVEALENIIVNSVEGVCIYMVSDDVFHNAMTLLKEIKEDL